MARPTLRADTATAMFGRRTASDGHVLRGKSVGSVSVQTCQVIAAAAYRLRRALRGGLWQGILLCARVERSKKNKHPQQRGGSVSTQGG
jgi:hypothetical protein